ncbi:MULTISPECIES: hypothetical protein [Streptomyces]|uniref:hypothetical protein n=1 Tax=Streptomyces TaxID=1883 RepID=UPI00206E3EFC|nr:MULTISPECIES: hypothetical protein [Streptomyces]UPT46759.1 hypothetical protein MWG59_38555 [Streptomyces sp. WAC00303]WIY80876.1 hypothetical protein QPM16_38185 [Streptomyces anulatus]
MEFGTTQAERLERLRGQLRGEPVGARAARCTPSSRGAGLLYGVMLHAASRLEAGLELTEVEQTLVRPLRLLLDEEEVHAFGRLYRQENAAGVTASVLPGTLTGRDVAEGYTAADLLKDLPALREETLAQPNVSTVDLNSPPAGEGDTFDTEEFNAGQAAYGYGATVVTSSAPPSADPGALGSFLARVDLYSFFCEKESNDGGFSYEIYWGLSSVGAFGDRQERLSRVFTNVDKNEWHDFGANTTTLYNGRVDTALVCNISCWEQDDGGEGWRDKLREKLVIISQELMAFVDLMTNIAIVIPQYGDMLDYMTLVAGIAYLIAKFIEWFSNPDDLVQERTLVFDQAALRHLVTDGGRGSTGWVFDGGIEGRYRLQLKWIGNPPPADAPGDIKVLSPANGQWGETVRLRGATGWEPALAVVGGALHVAQRGMDNNTWVGRFNGTTWGGYTQVPNHVSRATPALVEHQGKLHIATCGDGGKIYVAALNGSSWGSAWHLPGTTSAGPALAVRGGVLHCAVSGYREDTGVYMSWLTGDTWGAFNAVPGFNTVKAPALAEHQGKLYLAATGMNGQIYVTVHDGTAWAPSPMRLGGLSDSSPALTVRNGVLYCAVRTLDTEIALNSFDGTAWSGFNQSVPDAATMSGPALAGGSGDTLHIAYRTT